MSITVSQLYIYPIKSLGAVALDTIQLASGGPAWDRRWMIVDAQGRFVTQREFPKLALVDVALDATAATMRLTAPDTAELELPLVATNEWSQQVFVWNEAVSAVYGGEQAERWISAYLGSPAHLVYMPDTALRTADQDFAHPEDVVSFADAFPLLLIGEASLQDFNGHLQQPIEMLRFRPNIVIAGADPYAEDSWHRLQIGEVDYRVVKACARCVIPSINRASAQKEPQVSHALAQHRRGR
ncbi:MAG: MOSC domain-containing protein, partial [Pseudomonadales bacterium]